MTSFKSYKARKSRKSRKSKKSHLQAKIQEDQITDLNAVLLTEGTILPSMKTRFDPSLHRRVLIDTGACANVISKQTFDDRKNEKKLFAPFAIASSSLKQVSMAGGQMVSVETEATIEFTIADMTFRETLLVLNSANSTILGNPFFKKLHIHVFSK